MSDEVGKSGVDVPTVGMSPAAGQAPCTRAQAAARDARPEIVRFADRELECLAGEVRGACCGGFGSVQGLMLHGITTRIEETRGDVVARIARYVEVHDNELAEVTRQLVEAKTAVQEWQDRAQGYEAEWNIAKRHNRSLGAKLASLSKRKPVKAR